MDIAKLVAVGLGFVIYLGGSMFARRLRRRKKARGKDEAISPAAKEPTVADTASVKPSKAVQPIKAHAGKGVTGTKPAEEEVPRATETPAAKVKDQPPVTRKAPPKAPPKASPKAPSKPSGAPEMAWFLIKSKTGSVRVMQAKGKTPKTVAGPYPTKEDAYRARELTLARASASSGRTRSE